MFISLHPALPYLKELVWFHWKGRSYYQKIRQASGIWRKAETVGCFSITSRFRGIRQPLAGCRRFFLALGLPSSISAPLPTPVLLHGVPAPSWDPVELSWTPSMDQSRISTRDINRVLTRLTFRGIVCHLFHDERPHAHQEGEKQSEKRTESLIFAFAHTSPRTWAFPVAQTVKNLPAVRETWVRSLGWEDPLEEGMATHSSTLAWRIPMDRGAWRAIAHGVAKNWTRLSD